MADSKDSIERVEWSKSAPFGPVGTEDSREVQVRALRAGEFFNCPDAKCADNKCSDARNDQANVVATTTIILAKARAVQIRP